MAKLALVLVTHVKHLQMKLSTPYLPTLLSRLVSYYYFLRYGDDYRKGKIRSHMGDKTTFDECVAKKLRDCDPKKLWQQVNYYTYY